MPIKFETSLLRLTHTDSGEPGWYYLFVRNQGWTLRSLRDTRAPAVLQGTEMNHEAAICSSYRCDRQYSRQEVRDGFGIRNLPGLSEVNDWAYIAERLDAGPTRPNPAGLESVPVESGVRVVPITRLRKLYKLLRVTPKDLHHAIAQGMANHPNALADLCIGDVERISNYNNQEPFLPKRRSPLGAPQGSVIERTNDLVGFLCSAGGKFVVPGCPELECEYIERELNPLRTTRSVFETGGKARSSGGGGIDLLLLNKQDRTPVIAEVKVGEDTNCFFGLVQALTYAVELCTPHQHARLAKWLKDGYDVEISQDVVPLDIYLVLFDPPPKALDRELCELSKQVAKGLQSDPGFSKLIRRIVCLEAKMSGNQIVFNKQFSSHDIT